MTQFFFGLGTGRVASMAVANALNCDMNCIALHEGKARDMEVAGEQLLPFLTLQNRLAYENSGEALALAQQYRGQMREIAEQKDLRYFGDIAYNNTPFVTALHELYPAAKFIFQFRDCLSFVRSCTAIDKVDETPVGWPPEGKPLSTVERYIALGRIQPRTGSKEAVLWESWSYIAKNIWLWAETNRIALEALQNIPNALYFNFRFENFCADPVNVHKKLRNFLGMTGPVQAEAIRRLTERPINKRTARTCEVTLEQLNSDELDVYRIYADPVRAALAYVRRHII